MNPSGSATPRPHHLLTLPREIRSQIYQFVFTSPIPVPMKVDNKKNCIRPPEKASLEILRSKYLLSDSDHFLSSHVLRVCRQIYEEALPVLYGDNTFQVEEDHLVTLPRLSLPLRLCVQSLEVKYCTGDKFGLPPLAQCFPRLQKLDILCTKPIDALLLLSALTKSLPCTPLRCWPRLEVHALTPIDDDLENLRGWSDFHTILPAKHKELVTRAVSTTPIRLSNLHDAFSLRGIGLGKEMPDLSLIRVHSFFTPDHITTIKQHSCSMGNCRFISEPVQSIHRGQRQRKFCECDTKNVINLPKPNPQDTNRVEREEGQPYKAHQFVWNTNTARRHQAESVTIQTQEVLSTIMRQYAPCLPYKLHQEMIHAGMQPSQPPDWSTRTSEDVEDENEDEDSRESE